MSAKNMCVKISVQDDKKNKDTLKHSKVTAELNITVSTVNSQNNSL